MEDHDIDGVLDNALQLISEHHDLINAYITDFFVGARCAVPEAWLQSLSSLHPSELAAFMTPYDAKENLPQLPASLEAFRNLCGRLHVNEGPVGGLLFCKTAGESSWLQEVCDAVQHCPDAVPASLRKVMKPKKQHEVLRQGQVVAGAARGLQLERVLDLGAGHGHLARLLALEEGLSVTALEAAESCAPKASKLDRDATYRLTKSRQPLREPPRHLTCFVPSSGSLPELLAGECDPVLLTGLHACGDLTPTLLRLSTRSDVVRAAVTAGCCYMRCAQPWRPMSARLRRTDLNLSFEALELACHHITAYRARLARTEGQEVGGQELWRLRGQAFRAGFTVLLARANHRLQHGTGVRCGMQLTPNMNFRCYAEALVTKLGLTDLLISEQDWREVTELVDREWFLVILFYALRLMLGPVIETVLILDRLMFLREEGLPNSCLIRLFDCSQSPRNLAILAWKDCNQNGEHFSSSLVDE